MEGPLNNLRKNDMHLSKPVKMRNKKNPGAHFMTQAMYSAKDALMPPSIGNVHEPYAMHDPASQLYTKHACTLSKAVLFLSNTTTS